MTSHDIVHQQFWVSCHGASSLQISSRYDENYLSEIQKNTTTTTTTLLTTAKYYYYYYAYNKNSEIVYVYTKPYNFKIPFYFPFQGKWDKKMLPQP